MLDIFVTTLPIYLLIVIGYAAVRTGYVDGAHVQGLGQYALKIALIALIFSAVAFPRGEAGLNAPFVAAYLGGSLLTLVAGFAVSRLMLRRPAPESWILGMGMSCSNSGFLGFPIATLIFGADAAVVFAMTMAVENVVMLPLATVAAGLAGDRARAAALVRAALVRIATNPMVISVVLALVVRGSGVALPESLTRTVAMIAASAGPVALFVIGGTMARMSVSGHWRRTAAITVGKLGLHPLLVGAALMLVPGVPAELIPVGILFASVAMLTIYPILATPFGLGAVTSTALVVSTVLSCLTVSVVLHLVTG